MTKLSDNLFQLRKLHNLTLCGAVPRGHRSADPGRGPGAVPPGL